jgi:hypothetical protein
MQEFKGKTENINQVWRLAKRAPYFFIGRFWVLIVPAVTGAFCLNKPRGAGLFFYKQK